ncbi:hypothetical protein D3C78_636320 [compost metagenome]
MPFEEFGLALDSQKIGTGIAEDNQPPGALLADQVFQLGRHRINQQAIVGQQHLQVEVLL